MAETRLSDIVIHQALYAALAGVFVLIRLLPLGAPVAGGLVAPDLVLALTLAILLRRPDYVPVWLIAAVFLMADLLLLRPPGLWTLLVVAATEILRERRRFLGTLSLPMEFGLIALVLTLLAFAGWLARIVFLLDNPGLGPILMTVPSTMIAYPVILILTHYALGVRRRPAPPSGRFGGMA